MPALAKIMALGAALALMSCSPAEQQQQVPEVVVPDGHVGLRFRAYTMSGRKGTEECRWEVELGSEVVSFQSSVVSAGGGAHVQTLGAAAGRRSISSGAEIVFRQELLEGERLLGLLSLLAGAESVEALRASAPELERTSAYLYEWGQYKWGEFYSLGTGGRSVAPGSLSTQAQYEHGSMITGYLSSEAASVGDLFIHPLDQPIWLAAWVEGSIGATRSVEVDGDEIYIQTWAHPSESGEPVAGDSRVPFSEFEGRGWALQVEFASASR